ncbi:hypothetical protein ACTL6U_04005 [Rhodovibrionaceae bacterium A322]
MVPQAEEKSKSDGDPNVVALLSLNLILLAFFILLTALATYEEDRVLAVLASVSDTFDGEIAANRKFGNQSGTLGDLDASTFLLNDTGNLFSSTFPAAAQQMDVGGGELRMDVPADSYFFNGSELRAGPALLLDRFVRLLNDRRFKGLNVQVEILSGFSDPDYSNLSPESELRTSVMQAGVLVRQMVLRGLPAEQLSAGLLPSKPGTIRTILRIYEEPRPTFDIKPGVQ